MSADQCLSLASGRGVFHIGAWLATGMGDGDLGVRRDSGDKDLQGFLSGFLYLERWRRSGRAGLRREGAAS